nr:PDZ domain-containing protein [Pedobacter sp. ASV19]
MVRYFLVFVFILSAAWAKSEAPKQLKEVFVSVNGSDHNSGTIQSPYHSLFKALSVCQDFKGTDVRVLLRSGTYYLDKTILLNSKDMKCRSLKVESYAQEKVVISAGRKLDLIWKPFRDGIYQAKVPEGIVFERLYINGMVQQMARYPNYDPKARVFNGTASDAIDAKRVQGWKNPTGGYVHALHAGEWGSWDYLITGKDENGKLSLEGGWQNNRPSEMHKQYRFVENIMEELDYPGEWYLDRKSETLFYYPGGNVNLKTALVQVSNLKNSIELKGSLSQPVQNVELKGLTFEHNERSFMDTKEPLLRSDWTIYRGGAVLFDGTANCKITNCSFTGLGGNAIMLSNYNLRDSVTGCYVAHTGASAVCFVGNKSAVRSPLFNYNESLTYDKIDKTPGPLNQDYPQDCVVENNLFHHLGEIEKQATGVEIDISSSITVSHNSIYNTPRAGINIGDGCWGGHVIAFNDVFNTVQETGDHGAFNSWGRDRFWNPDRGYMDSIVKVHPELILLDARKPVLIHNNRLRCDHGWDIDLDDGSSNYHIYNNVCLNGGLKLREGFYRVVQNNIIINNSFHPHVWFENSGDVFERNIVTKNYFPIRIKDWGKRIDYNVFFNAADLGLAQNSGTDRHSVSGDVRFKNADKGDYTLMPNSPALAVGFKNIPMNQFGVQKASLKKIALRPEISPLLQTSGSADAFAVVPFLGGEIKSVNGLGDRSVYGLPDENGVIIIRAGKNSLLSQSGLQDKDVIRAAAGKDMITVQDLQEIVESQKRKPSIAIEIMRNQKLKELILKLK